MAHNAKFTNENTFECLHMEGNGNEDKKSEWMKQERVNKEP